jgi:hypothetical protein
MVYIPNEDVPPTSVSTVRTKTGVAGDTELNTNPREPTVFDYAQSNQFKVYIPIFPLVEWFVVSCNVPGVTMGQGVVATPLIDMPVVGEKLTYDNFSMTFLVDEKLKNFMELHNWLVNMAPPENMEQFMAITSDYVLNTGKSTLFYPPDNQDSQARTGNTSDRQLYCDITLFILSSKNNPVATVVMRDAFPVSLSSLDYSQQETDTSYVQCNVTFAYPFYTIQAV